MNRPIPIAFTFLLFTLLILWNQQTPADTLWPTYRRDQTRSGISPLRGGMSEAPKVLWSVDLGGRQTTVEQIQFSDLDGDGVEELLRVGPNYIACELLLGQEQWRIDDLPNPKITGIYDFNRQERQAILVESNDFRQTRSMMIDGHSGQAFELYQRQSVFGYRYRMANFLKDESGQQLIAVWDGWGNPGQGQKLHLYLWQFNAVSNTPKQLLSIHESGNIFGVQPLVADLEGDGSDELILISMQQAWVYDLLTGTRKGKYAWSTGIRTYSAYIDARRVEGVKGIVLSLINPHIPGVQVIILEPAGTTQVVWKQVIGAQEDQYQQKIKVKPAIAEPIQDLDGDKNTEILVSFTAEEDNKPHLIIFDGRTGKRLYQSQIEVLTIDNLDGQNGLEVVYTEGEKLHLGRWINGKLESIWSAEQVQPILNISLQGATSTTTPNRSKRNPTLRRSIQDQSLFGLKFGDQKWVCHLQEDGTVEPVRLAMPDELPDSNTIKKPTSNLTYTVTNSVLTVKRHAEVISTRSIPKQQTYMPPPALVDEASGFGILVRDFEGNLLRLSPEGEKIRTWIGQSPSHPHNYENHFSQAEFCDLDGDGRYELLTTTTAGATSVGRIVALDVTGKETLSIEAFDRATEVCLGATGVMTKGGRWITVAYRFANGNPLEVAYDGQTGELIWQRDQYAGDLVRFGYPCPTIDYDGDGNQDMVVSAGNYYGILDVVNNRHLVGPVVLGPTHLPGHWSTRFRPILVPRPNGSPDVFLHRNNGVSALLSLSGTYRWHYSLLPRDNMPFNQEGIADLDGDGNFEVITAHRDGLLRAFNSKAGNQLCPTCEPETELTPYNRSAVERWTHKITGAINPSVYRSDQDFATVDLDGDGAMEILIGDGEGTLYALKEQNGVCTTLWKLSISTRRLGSPVVADIDGDGQGEILIPSEDGIIHCLK